MDFDFWVKVSALIGVPLTVIGLVLSYLSFRNQAKQTKKDIVNIGNRIETITETISIHNQYQSQGIVNNYIFNQAPMDDNQIKRAYEQTANEGKKL